MFELDTFPILETERLSLRQYEKADAARIMYLRSDPTINSFVKINAPKNEQEAFDYIDKINEGFVKGDWIKWGIHKKEDDLLIGSISLWEFSYDRKKAEVGYVLDHFFWGKGFLSEAWGAVKSFAQQELRLEKIEAWTHCENVKSIRLLERQGFQQKKKVLAKDNEEGYDLYVYELEIGM